MANVRIHSCFMKIYRKLEKNERQKVIKKIKIMK